MVYLHDKVLKKYQECVDCVYIFFDGSLKYDYDYRFGKNLNYRTFYRHISNNNAVKIFNQQRLNDIFCSFEVPWYIKSFDFDRYDLFLDGFVKLVM